MVSFRKYATARLYNIMLYKGGKEGKMRFLTAYLPLIIFVPSLVVEAQQSNYSTQTHHFESSIVNDEFVLNVSLPPSYANSDDTYPILVILDGDKSYGMARDIVDWLSWSQEIPQLIVVGIGYGGSMQEWWQKRSRDFTPTKDQSKIWGEWPLAGGANAFQAFISKELIPYLDKKYRTKDDRLLAGLSFGGLFCSYTLFTKPEMVNRYIIVSPALAWDNKVIWKLEKEYFSSTQELDADVYTAVGGKDERIIIKPWESFNELISNRKYKGLTWNYAQYKEDTHISSWPVALTRGLKTIFESNSK